MDMKEGHRNILWLPSWLNTGFKNHLLNLNFKIKNDITFAFDIT